MKTENIVVFRDASKAKQSKTKRAGSRAWEQTQTCHIEYSDQNNSGYLVLRATLPCFLQGEGGLFSPFHFPILGRCRSNSRCPLQDRRVATPTMMSDFFEL